MARSLVPLIAAAAAAFLGAAAGFAAPGEEGGLALVPSSVLEGLRQRLQTPWRLVPTENASDADVAMATALAPSFGFVQSPRLLEDVLRKAVRGKLLQWTFTGVDLLNLSTVPTHFSVCDVHQAGVAIPEYVLAAVLSWNVRLPQTDAAFRTCAWQPNGGVPCPDFGGHRETRGQTIGIVGYGTIGTGLAERAAALGMRVIAVTHPLPATKPGPVAWIGDDAKLPQLMSESDFVVVACPLLPATRGLVSAAAIGHMKPSGVLINIARGPIVDEEGLYEALKAGRIGGAVLDVWWNDWAWRSQGGGQPSRFDFAGLPNVWMTPHLSGNTPEAHLEVLNQVAANFDALYRGEPLHNVVRNATISGYQQPTGPTADQQWWL